MIPFFFVECNSKTVDYGSELNLTFRGRNRAILGAKPCNSGGETVQKWGRNRAIRF